MERGEKLWVYVIYNVGVRDLRYNVGSDLEPDFCSLESQSDQELVVAKLGMDIERTKPGARLLSKEILERLDQLWNSLRFPIFKSALRQVLSQHDRIDLLCLIVTDQDPRIPFAARDTVHIGEILKRLVERDFRGRVAQIKLWSIQERPHEDESATKFFKGLLDQLPLKDEETIVYGFISAGIPAMNNALKDQLILMTAEQSPRIVLHLHRVQELPEEELRRGREDEPIIDDAVHIFLHDLLNQAIKTLLDRYDYSGALALMNTYKAYGFWDERLYKVLTHAAQRVNFDFYQAGRTLEGLKDEGEGESPFKDWCEQPETEGVRGLDGRLRRLVELYFVIQIKYDDEAYADLLWRVAAFYENASQVVIARVLNLSLDELIGNDLSAAKLRRHHPELNKHLEGMPQGERPRKRSSGKGEYWVIDRRFLKACTSFIDRLKGVSNIDLWKRALELLTSLDGLYNLRNEVLHDLQGVSRQRLNFEFPPPAGIDKPYQPGKTGEADNLAYLLPTLQEILSLILRSLGKEELHTGLSPYQELNEYALRRL